MKYTFHPEALEEYSNAAAYYSEISPRFAELFIQSIEAGVQAILTNPRTWPVVEDNTRRYLLKRFPFGVYYCIEENQIVVYAIMHMNRHPDYWKNRIERIR